MSAGFTHAQATSADDTCQKIEYAELKDTPKDDLIDTYCNYKFEASIEHQRFEADLKLYDATGDRGASDSADADSRQSIQCLREADRIAGVLKKVYQLFEPTKADCDANDAKHEAEQEAKHKAEQEAKR